MSKLRYDSYRFEDDNGVKVDYRSKASFKVWFWKGSRVAILKL